MLAAFKLWAFDDTFSSYFFIIKILHNYIISKIT